MTSSILVAHDGSSHAQAALEYAIETDTAVGRPHRVIAAYVEDSEIDQVVMGTERRRTVSRQHCRTRRHERR